jgi:ATP phosphoribosyltransferase regulatory subunit HisZ
MIDPISAFAAVKSAHSVIMQGIKIGKDLSSMSGYISRWAIGEANLDMQAEKKGSSLFGKFSSVEAEAIQAHLRKEELRNMRNELREIFALYGSPGQWERLQGEIAAVRAAKKKHLRQIEDAKQARKTIIISVAAVIGLLLFIYYELKLLKII